MTKAQEERAMGMFVQECLAQGIQVRVGRDAQGVYLAMDLRGREIVERDTTLTGCLVKLAARRREQGTTPCDPSRAHTFADAR